MSRDVIPVENCPNYLRWDAPPCMKYYRENDGLMSKPPSTWKKDELVVAEQLGEALDTVGEYGHKTTRVPLSGSNNRRTDGTPHRGDISLPDKYDALFELKRRAAFMHQRMMDTAKKDAAKHGLSHTFLITKQKGQRGFTAIMEWDLLRRILAVPGVKELLKK